MKLLKYIALGLVICVSAGVSRAHWGNQTASLPSTAKVTSTYKIVKILLPKGYDGSLNIKNSNGQKVTVEVINSGNGVYYLRIKKDIDTNQLLIKPDYHKPETNEPLILI